MVEAAKEVDRIGQLEDELKIANRRIEDLKAERDEARDLASRMQEHVENVDALIESWIEGFNLVLGDDGMYRHQMAQVYDAKVVQYNDLLKCWNRFVPKYNAVILQRDAGRPLAASDAQCVQVRKLRKGNMSLRDIAEETSLSLQTVRTIIGRELRSDRTSVRRLQKVDPDHAAVTAWKARKRTRDALPRRINETLAEGVALLKAAKGLGN